MIEIVSFLFFKMCAVVAVALLWGWPPFVAVLAWVCLCHGFSTWWQRTWTIFVITFGALGTVTYWGAIWPGDEPSDKDHHHPIDALYYFTIRGLEDQKKRDEADKQPVRTELGAELRRYRLDGWNPPKHFYVYITDLATGQRHENVYVSKHCGGASSLKRGEEYNITLNKYSLSNQPGVVFYEFANLYNTFCS